MAATPVATRMDGVDIQAQLIENILDGTRLKRPVQARWLELLGFVVLALLLILFLPRLSPIYGVVIYLASARRVGEFSWLSFQHFSVLYDPTFPVAGNGLIVAPCLRPASRRRIGAGVSSTWHWKRRGSSVGIAENCALPAEIQMGVLPRSQGNRRAAGQRGIFRHARDSREMSAAISTTGLCSTTIAFAF